MECSILGPEEYVTKISVRGFVTTGTIHHVTGDDPIIVVL